MGVRVAVQGGDGAAYVLPRCEREQPERAIHGAAGEGRAEGPCGRQQGGVQQRRKAGGDFVAVHLPGDIRREANVGYGGPGRVWYGELYRCAEGLGRKEGAVTFSV